MSSDKFGTWWPCLRKHYKRTKLWLPEIKKLSMALAGARPIRYFTLCARPMIDVYMLVRENVLPRDISTRRIEGVSFCELNETIFPEMKELVGVEEAGFLAKLEDILLFQDVAETELLDTVEAISAYVDEQGEGIEEVIRRAIDLKRKHLQLRSAFPFDFLNLDFCDRYYGDSPNVMALHKAIEKILEWQQRPLISPDGTENSIGRFTIAVTCRVDSIIEPGVVERLRRIVNKNASDNPAYSAVLKERGTFEVARWSQDDPLDFFMSAWPKEIAKAAREKAWDISIKNHAFYDRTSRSGTEYHMVCLILEFQRTDVCTTYLPTVLEALDETRRTQIIRFDSPLSADGQWLLADLTAIVALRNEQASAFSREPLPSPSQAIEALRKEGVAI